MILTQALIALAVMHCRVNAAEVFTAALKRTKSIPPSSRALASQRLASEAPLHPVEGGLGFNIDIKFGGETFEVAFDTGSSDLWLLSAGFDCVGPDGGDPIEDTCQLGKAFAGGFSDGRIKDQHFNITYGSGEFLLGMMGYQDVTIAGVTVPNQEVALVDYGFWAGGDQTSGLLGFSYPFLTSAFQGTDPSVDKVGVNQATYSPFLFSAVQQGLIDPVFSLDLQRDADSQLVLGGLPQDMDFSNTEFASTPIIPTNLGTYAFYAVLPDGFLLQAPRGGKRDFEFRTYQQGPAAELPVLIDSGTTLSYLPAPLFNKIFPSAMFIPESNIYEMDCSATPPSFAVRLSGQDFPFAPEEMLLQGELGMDTDTGLCVTGIQPVEVGTGAPILGDTFLKNVVAVFDVGQGMMRFAAK